MSNPSTSNKNRNFNCKITRIKVIKFKTFRQKVSFRQDYKKYFGTMKYNTIATYLDNVN